MRLNTIYGGKTWRSDCFDPRRQIGQFVEHQTRGIKAGNRDGGGGGGEGLGLNPGFVCHYITLLINK